MSTTTKTTQGIEHAGTEETDKGNHAQLDARRGIPRDGDRSQLSFLVYETIGKSELLVFCGEGGLVHLGGSTDFLIVGHLDSSAAAAADDDGRAASLSPSSLNREWS